MGVHRILASEVRAQFPAGTVLHNPVSGEYARVVEHTPGPVDAALLAEAFGDEIVFERPPRAVQQALARTVAPIARRRGRSVTREVLLAAIIPTERCPAQDDGSNASSP